jgi:hypothetical protein
MTDIPIQSIEGEGPNFRGCEDLVAAEFDTVSAAEIAWNGLVHSGSFVEGRWSFADDKPGEPPATLKVIGERLLDHPFWRPILVGLFAAYPCVQTADVLTFVPDGPGDFTGALGQALGKSVAYTERTPGGARHDFRFKSPADAELAADAKQVFAVEDVLTTGSSVSAARRLFRPDQGFHSLAVLLRGLLKPEYCIDIGHNNEGPHYLVARAIPRTADGFRKQFKIEPAAE